MLPPNDHFLWRPVLWTQTIWQRIVSNRGNVEDVRSCFNVLSVIEAHIEDLIGLHLLKAHQNGKGEELLQDYFVHLNTDHWETEKALNSPSILQQLCRKAQEYNHYLSTNYYFALLPSIESEDTEGSQSKLTMANNISGTDFTTASEVLRNNYEVDVIDLEQLDKIIAQQHEQGEQEDVEMTQESTPLKDSGTSTKIYMYRIDIRRSYRQRSADTLPEAFKKFVIAMKHADKFSAVRPVYISEATRFPPINSGTQVQRPELLDISRYHQPWTPNQRWALTGSMAIESSLSFPDLKKSLAHWLNDNNYTLTLSECQTSELVTIGILAKSSFTLNRNDLSTSLQNIIADLPDDESFMFTLRLDKWFCRAGEKGGVDMIFVAVERTKIIQGTNFFCRTYDGVNKKIPLGIPLWFIPTYQIEITDEVREKIGQEQRSWRANEVACFVHGFQDLATRVLLTDKTTCTIRNLIYRFLTNDPGSPRKTLFHGVDKCTVHEGWIYVKYHRDDAAIFRRRAKYLASEINKLIEDGEESKVFTNIDVGLQFGGEITKTYSVTNQRSRSRQPAPTDAGVLDHFNSIINRMQNVAVKRATITPDHNQRRRPTTSTTSQEQSYATATRAASTTYTSTTHTSDTQPDQQGRGTVQTTTQSVTVIEERYERRFVGIETMCRDNALRIEKMEKTTTTTARCIQALLDHQGIVVDTDDTESTSLTSLSGEGSGRMDLEHSGQPEGGTKRVRHVNHTGSQTSLHQHNHD